MSQADLETVQRIFSGWRTGDFSAEANAFDPQIVIRMESVMHERDALEAAGLASQD